MALHFPERRVLVGVDAAGPPGELTEYERITLHGVAGLPGRRYPPPGHGGLRP
ncbi:hypothetical protein ACFV4Q_24010 [Streptomyces nojiriensis]|uniref:hypothetical protein n=1 Tax=Streptomyces nojiriensis TaxID=66374 RepID=UPI0036484DA7